MRKRWPKCKPLGQPIVCQSMTIRPHPLLSGNLKMPKKSSHVILTLLGSAVMGVGCSQSAPQPVGPAPADPMVGRVDFEKRDDDPQSSLQPIVEAGAAGVEPGTVAGQTSHSQHSHGMRHTSHYSRGYSMLPLLWGLSSRSGSIPSQQPMSQQHSQSMNRPMTPPPVPRGPSHVIPPPIPSHGSTAANSGSHSTAPHVTPSHSAPSHTSTTHSSSSSHVSSHGFGSTGHAVSGGS